ncbi:MAG: alpha/beta hydrolase [Nitrospira sp.]|nr:alpha/beta hydrolase [Nitrospira sp.]
MKIRLMVVPPGGGEIDYVNLADVPAIPREGDYVTIVRAKSVDHFMVRRIWWNFKELEDGEPLEFADNEVWVEVEEAIGPFTNEAKREGLKDQGAKKFEVTAY